MACMIMIRLTFLLSCGVLGALFASGQAFTGVEGSIYGGVVNTGVQPGAGAGMPYYWDVQVAGINSFWQTNALSVSPARRPWTGGGTNTDGYYITGEGEKWLALQADLHLLNGLLRWPGRNDLVVGAGWNVHSNTRAENFNYDYEPSMKTMDAFLEANAFNRLQRGRILNQQWSEWYLTASGIIRNDSRSLLSVGGTVKLAKGMSAVVIDVDGLSVDVEHPASGPDEAFFNYFSARYGYSRNLEEFSDHQGAGEFISTLFDGSPVTPSVSAGLSYWVKKPEYIAGFINDDPAGYDWKFEAAITDIGRIKYALGSQSAVITGLKEHYAVDRFSRMLDSATTLNRFNDSLKEVMDLAFWQGAMSLSLPTALRINIDKNLGRHFYVNARAVLDLSFLDPGVDYRMRQNGYFMLTPRWEIRRVGIYAPLYVNGYGSVMAGASLRLGPLMAGIHDFRWLFRNSSTGGAYVSLVIRRLIKDREDCPTY